MATRQSHYLHGLPVGHLSYGDNCFSCLRELTINSLTYLSVQQTACCGKFTDRAKQHGENPILSVELGVQI